MTDIGHWWHLPHRTKSPPGEPCEECDKEKIVRGGDCEYIMLPFNEYQMGNLLGLLKRSQDKANGDWFLERVAIIMVAMRNLGIEEVHSNWGDVFRADKSWQEQSEWKSSG